MSFHEDNNDQSATGGADGDPRGTCCAGCSCAGAGTEPSTAASTGADEPSALSQWLMLLGWALPLMAVAVWAMVEADLATIAERAPGLFWTLVGMVVSGPVLFVLGALVRFFNRSAGIRPAEGTSAA